MRQALEKMAIMLMERTINRMEDETILSNKTLNMISLSDKLFTTLSTWGGDNFRFSEIIFIERSPLTKEKIGIAVLGISTPPFLCIPGMAAR